jgi:phage-related protein
MAEKKDEQPRRKRVEWLGRTQPDIATMPDDVKVTFGTAVRDASFGRTSPNATPMPAIGPGVFCVRENADGNTYREFYTVHFEDFVYVLDVFQKKSTRGIATPQVDIDRIKGRFDIAKELHAKQQKKPDSR